MTAKPRDLSQRHNEAGSVQPALHGLLDEARNCECKSSDKQQLKQWLNSKKSPILKVV